MHVEPDHTCSMGTIRLGRVAFLTQHDGRQTGSWGQSEQNSSVSFTDQRDTGVRDMEPSQSLSRPALDRYGRKHVEDIWSIWKSEPKSGVVHKLEGLFTIQVSSPVPRTRCLRARLQPQVSSGPCVPTGNKGDKSQA
ncbi:unnamed protein product [Pleuronectes platessa]|uniref:Uncharacterized protein n=1 Tax=Pleuronectes platessa TaxID=8262 RepID=A0A9N7YHQ2_PLEPL|nr:unnamed protein product [Pleuronectes platessa]